MLIEVLIIMRVDTLVQLSLNQVKNMLSIIDEGRLRERKKYKMLYYVLLCYKMFDMAPLYSSIYSCIKLSHTFSGYLHVETIDEQSINKFELILTEIVNSLEYIFVIKSIVPRPGKAVYVILSDDYCDFYIDFCMTNRDIKTIDYSIIDNYICEVEMELV